MIVMFHLAHSALDVMRESCGATYDQYTYLPFGSTHMRFSMFLSIWNNLTQDVGNFIKWNIKTTYALDCWACFLVPIFSWCPLWSCFFNGSGGCLPNVCESPEERAETFSRQIDRGIHMHRHTALHSTKLTFLLDTFLRQLLHALLEHIHKWHIFGRIQCIKKCLQETVYTDKHFIVLLIQRMKRAAALVSALSMWRKQMFVDLICRVRDAESKPENDLSQ